MKSVCPNCEKTTEIKIETKNEIFKIKGKDIPILSEFSVCNECHEEFATADQMEGTLNAGYNQYRKEENIITPQEIIDIRQKYGASQKAFAKILDLGELTINSFEQGSLPSKSVSNLIRLIHKPENFTELFDKNKNKLSSRQIKKIEYGLSEQIIPIYQFDLDEAEKVKEKYTGYLRPDWERVLAVFQLMLYFSEKEIYKMSILKISFYIDFAYYKHNTVSITGWPYARLLFGPVPQNFKQLLYEGEEAKLFYSKPDYDERGELYYLDDDFNSEFCISKFTDSQINMIKEVVKELKNKTATELKVLTHKEKAWLKTKNADLIDYKWAKDLILF